MISGPHRMKGGAAQLGATTAGDRGPFGVCSQEEEPEDERGDVRLPPSMEADQPSGSRATGRSAAAASSSAS